MRRNLILGGLTLAVIVAGVISLAAFTAQVVNLTARVEKDIARCSSRTATLPDSRYRRATATTPSRRRYPLDNG